MSEGYVIQFDARVDDYTKGYERDRGDDKLSRPTKVVNLGQIERILIAPPEFHDLPDNSFWRSELEWMGYKRLSDDDILRDIRELEEQTGRLHRGL